MTEPQFKKDKEIIEVVAVQDDSSHWYVVPKSESKEFNDLFEKMLDNEDDYDLQDEFEEKFSKYRTGGDLNNVQLWALKDDLGKGE